MRHIVIGTAGHIDHGKSALVRALTGIEPDRLEEEKRRGISIDLGFAHLMLPPDIRIAFIDVPGHERFIKNMLAGVGGIDAVLFVIAANESIRPQTREHFDICRLLRVQQGVVALTKADLVEEDLLGLVRLELADLAAGSFLDSASVIPVSSVTGEGLRQLRDELGALVANLPKRDIDAFPRMPVDRAFSVSGFGSVATGTVVSGTVERESLLQVYPGTRVVRVRGIQAHGDEERSVRAGQRAALNLAGIEASALPRGSVLGEPGVFRAITRFDASLELLASAKPLRSGSRVHFHSGTGERDARVRVLGGSPTAEPGSTELVRIVLTEPLLVLPGDRFIVRMFSPVTTIGGGEVLETAPPERQRRSVARDHVHKLWRSENLSDKLAAIAGAMTPGISMPDLVSRTGKRPGELRAALPKSLREREGWLLATESVERLYASWHQRLQEFHCQFPLLQGMSKEAFRTGSASAVPQPVFEALLTDYPLISVEGDLVRLRSHQVEYQSDEVQALEEILQAFAKAGLTVPPVDEVIANCGIPLPRARTLLQTLLREKRLVRVGADLVFHESALESLRSLLAMHVGQRFSVSEFKDWTGISRKYAIPLLEYLDRQHLTSRDGNTRVVSARR